MERTLRSVFVASSTAPWAASSQLCGDCDISSITLTTLAMMIYSPFSIYGRSRATRAFLVAMCLTQLVRALAFGKGLLVMRSCYDERDSAQHSNRGEHVTHRDWFAE